MTKIIFVCHGNICTSPMAEAIFRHLVEERGLSDRFQIDSAAVSDEEVGRPVDWRPMRNSSGAGCREASILPAS